MKKRKIREKATDITDFFDDCKLSDLINFLEKTKKDLKKFGYSKLEIEKHYIFGGGGDDQVEFYLYGEREETDKEYEKRMKKNKKKREINKENKVKQKEREIKRLKELIEKYPEESKK